MSKLWILGAAFLLLLAAFPLISFGTTGGNDTLWWAGLALLTVGALIPPVARYAIPDEEEEVSDKPKDSDETSSAAEPARIRVAPTEPEESEESAADPPQARVHEQLALSHEQRAEAHLERARAHDELARAEEERARAEAERGGIGGFADDATEDRESDASNPKQNEDRP